MTKNPNDWTGSALSDGRYQVAAKLGEGGMGIVYRARDRNLDSEVVIKVPRRAMLDDPEFANRFAREIRSLVKLSHPCIVKITDVGEFDGLPFAVMQYLPGGSLEDRQAVTADGRGGGLDPKAISGWLTGVAGALDFIHSQGYVHRDVKPGNILFDAQGHAYLSDFGVAKTLASSAEVKAARTAATGAGLVLGTPEYMAPELIMGEPFDGRIDQYALAVTVYEMLCGRRPFEGSTPTAVMVLHTTRPAPSLSDLRTTIPGRVSQAVLKGLAKDPAGRYPSCVDLAAAVVAALVASPVVAGASGIAQAQATPSGSGSDSVRIRCPACGKKIAVGASTFANLKRTGRSFPCPGCQGPIQVSAPGTQVLGTPSSSSSSGSGLIPTGTTKLTTEGLTPTGTQKLSTARPTPSPTVVERVDPRPASGPAPSTVRVEALNLVVADPAEPPTATAPRAARSPGLWIGIGAAAAVLVVGAALALRPSAPARGTVRIELPAPAAGAEIELDQKRYAFDDLAEPLTLPAGSHLLAVSKPGYQPYRQTFLVNQGANPDLRVRLTRGRAPEPEPAPSPAPAPSPKPELARVDPAPPAPKPDRPAARPAAGSVASSRAIPTPPAAPATPEATGATTELASASEDRPADTPADSEPSPSKGVAASKDSKPADVPLKNLLAEPAKYADQVVTPSGLFRFGNLVTYRPDGTTTIPVIQSVFDIKINGAIYANEGGQTAELDIDPGLADKLIVNKVAQRKTRFNENEAGWGRNGAILTLRVMKGSGMSPGAGWLLRIIKAELLVNLDFPRIYERKFARAFRSYTIRPAEESLGVGEAEEWQKRLGIHFLNNVAKVFKNYKNQVNMAKSIAINKQIGSMVNQSIRQVEAANAAAAAERNATSAPRRVVSGSSVLNREIILNAELVR